MATQEYYVRNPADTEARGPYTLEQIKSQAEIGQVTPETLYYDANAEQWVVIGSNAELKASLFPEKKKLSLKKQTDFKPINQEKPDAAPITVDQMLAAAEGRTDETKDKQDPEIAAARAAKIGMIAAILTLLAAAGGEVVPNVALIMSMDWLKIAFQPLVILGAVDVVLAVLLGLGAASLYPLVRFRAMLGLGFLGFVFFVHGQSTAFLALAAGSVGLYLCTVFVSLLPVVIAALLGVLGMAAVAWQLLSA